jgi:Phospholipase_D-nuclease N-terminal
MQEMFGLFLVTGVLVLVAGLLAIAACVFWIWMLIHAVTNNGIGTGEKVAWVLVILFLHVLGAFIYLFIGYPKAT